LNSVDLLREVEPDKRRAMDCIKDGAGGGWGGSAGVEFEEETSLAADKIMFAGLLAEGSFGGVGGCEAADARREKRPLRGFDCGLAAVAVVAVVLVVGVETALVRTGELEAGGVGAGVGVGDAAGGEVGEAADCGVAGSGFVADLVRPFTLAREAAVRGLVKRARHWEIRFERPFAGESPSTR
jgi:hypothetical protein